MNEQYGLAPSSFCYFCCSYLRFAVDDVVSEVLDSCHGAESSDYDNERWRRLVRHRSLSLSSLSLFFSRYSSRAILLALFFSLTLSLSFQNRRWRKCFNFLLLLLLLLLHFFFLSRNQFLEKKRERERRERERERRPWRLEVMIRRLWFRG